MTNQEMNIQIVRHIIQARQDQAMDKYVEMAWKSVGDIFEYFLEGNTECLLQFDYLMTNKDAGLE